MDRCLFFVSNPVFVRADVPDPNVHSLMCAICVDICVEKGACVRACGCVCVRMTVVLDCKS